MNAAVDDDLGVPDAPWRRRLHRIVFEADTTAGRAFDVVVVWLIVTSVAVVVLDSVAFVRARHGTVFNVVEWGFTLLFTLEYLARLAAVKRQLRYVFSFYGVIDLLALLPTYLAIFMPDLYALIDVRILRLLRIFRIFKLGEYVKEFGLLGQAVYATRRKIAVFLAFVLMVTLVMGTLMYVVEGPANGFTSIPIGVYWAITTLTTVGFGDIVPSTGFGRFIASVMMLLGWGTLAVPTGIVSAEFTAQRFDWRRGAPERERDCPTCGSDGHPLSARYCRDCGAALPVVKPRAAPR
jgi:voltage-gated potassium channel